MDKKIGMLCVEGQGARFATGQAVKGRTLRKWFCGAYGEDQVLFGNIDSAKKHPIRVLNNMLRVLRHCKNIVFMPGQNIEVFAPALHIMNRLFRRKVLYIVTGGDLAEVIKRRPSLGKTIAHFDGTFVQSIKLRDELRGMGITRAEYLPNCRDYVADVPFDHYGQRPLRLCTYSRVTKEKGILDAIEICKKANALIGRQAFVLEVYGKMYDAFEPEFQKVLEENREDRHLRGGAATRRRWRLLRARRSQNHRRRRLRRRPQNCRRCRPERRPRHLPSPSPHKMPPARPAARRDTAP